MPGGSPPLFRDRRAKKFTKHGRESRRKMRKNKKSSGDLAELFKGTSTLPVDAMAPMDVIQGLYVMRLVEEGVSVEEAFDLIVDGVLRPN